MMVATTGAQALFGAALAAVACLLWPASAHASGDIGCTASWKLRHRDLTGCDSMAMLSPGNDTRINLVMLLSRGARSARSAVPVKPGEAPPSPLFDWSAFEQATFPKPEEVGDDSHAQGEGSRCLSDAAGTAEFAAAVGASKRLSASEKTVLVAARRGLRPTCSGSAAAAPTTGLASPEARGFAAYLEGAGAFYAGDFDTAAIKFAALAAGDQPWLRETARYMLGRVEVNRAQVGAFDEFGARDDKHAIDPKVTAAAEARLRGYLKAYPDGRYALSARGLLRRVYWLGADTAKLAAEYVALFARPPAARGLDDADLAEEIDTKLLPQLAAADTSDPTLLAVVDLRAMRGADDEPISKALITRADLEAQRPHFAREPALFDHLLAAYAFYVEKRPAMVLGLIPDAARQGSFDSVQFSRQMLRGMALDATGDRNARGFWLEVMPGAAPPFQRTTVELALALHDERTAGLDRVFAAGSPIGDATLRDILLTDVADAPLLRRQAGDASVGKHERAVALFTLLYKDVTRGAYRDFVTDIAVVPPGASAKPDIYNFVGTNDPSVGIFVNGSTHEDFACPSLRATAGRLAAAPQDAAGLLCVAEFVRLNGMDGFFLDTQPPADELGGTRTRFPGRPFSRLEIYKAVIGNVKAPPADRAYALFRAVNCYAPSRANGCGGTDVPPAQRKAWFQQLHTGYPTSRWAGELRYYW